MTHSRNSINPRGFTLVEILVAMALTGVVMAALYSVYISYLRHPERQDEFTRTEMNVRAALDMMAREIRMAGFPAGVSTGFERASSLELAFNYDHFNPLDAITDEERISYRFNAARGEIQRRFRGGDWTPIANEIADLQFEYRVDDELKIPSDPEDPDFLAKIRSVRITVSGAASSRNVSMEVRCRNLGL